MPWCDNCKKEPGHPYQIKRYTAPSHPLDYTQVKPRFLGYFTRIICDRCIAADRKREMRRLKIWWILVIFMGLLSGGYYIRQDSRAFEFTVFLFLGGFLTLLGLTIIEFRRPKIKRGEDLVRKLMERQK